MSRGGGGTGNLNTHPLSMQDGFEIVPCTVEEVEKIVFLN